MFKKSVKFYDAIYRAIGKDYAGEVDYLHPLIQSHKLSTGNRLLDVACGTGGHITYLKALYTVEGLDLEPNMLAAARVRHPAVQFHCADMIDFDLDRQFDVVLCLFSSVGYVKTKMRLGQAVSIMSRHLVPGGVLIVEPWFTPDGFRSGTVHATYVDERELKLARINVSEVVGLLAVMNMHYLVGTPDDVFYFTELHELGLFTHEEYISAFRVAGLEVVYDPEGLIGRGLYIGVRKADKEEVFG